MKENTYLVFGIGAGIAFLLGISIILVYSIKIAKYQIKKKRYINIVNMVPIFLIIIIGTYIGFSLYKSNYRNGNILSYFLFLIFPLFLVGIKLTRLIWPIIKEIDYNARHIVISEVMLKLSYTPTTNIRAQHIIENIVDKICTENCIDMPKIIVCCDLETCALTNSKSGIIYIHECMEQLEENRLAALIGHELIHWKYRDGLKNVAFLDLLIQISSIYLFVCYLKFTQLMLDTLPIVGVILVMSCFLLVLFLILFLIASSHMDTQRYWLQIKEIRADRLACELNGVTIDGMLKLLKYFYNEQSGADAKMLWHEEMYIRYFAMVPHPALTRRIHLIEKYKKWSLLDYFLHFFIMIRWFITFRGWNGE